MQDAKQLFDTLQLLLTEQRNPASMQIDMAATYEIVSIINTEDHLVPIAVRRELAYVAQAVDIVVEAFQNGGRLLYVGAGTSGRLGVLDASECPPTYGVPYDMVQGVMAGGIAAIFRPQEGAEDKPDQAAADLQNLDLKAQDVVCGIAASSRTPYVLGALTYAQKVGAKTLFVTTNPRQNLKILVDVAICPEVGPEVVMGSTRMKSGTAQKLVLNMITTAAMIRLGKVYENMMVDLQLTNQKLLERSKRIVMLATECSYEQAQSALEESEGHVKTAIVMILTQCTKGVAQLKLASAGGFVRGAIT